MYILNCSHTRDEFITNENFFLDHVQLFARCKNPIYGSSSVHTKAKNSIFRSSSVEHQSTKFDIYDWSLCSMPSLTQKNMLQTCKTLTVLKPDAVHRWKKAFKQISIVFPNFIEIQWLRLQNKTIILWNNRTERYSIFAATAGTKPNSSRFHLVRPVMMWAC